MEIITLNIVPKGITPVCHASQFDIGRTIRLAIVDELHGYIFSDEEVELRVRKPDDNVVTASVEVTSGNAYVDIVTTEQMTACEGVNKCELRITKGGVRIGSLNFDMKVEVDPLKDGIESETEIHNLETQIRDIDEEIVPELVAEEVANQYDSENVIFDDHPTPGHGTGYVVKSENVPSELNDLDDVDISGQAQGEALVWDSVNNKWVNGTVSTVGSIDDLDDVDTTGKSEGDNLRYDGNEWVAQPTTVKMTLAEWEAMSTSEQTEWLNSHKKTRLVISDAPNLNETAKQISYDGGTDTVWDKVEANKSDITNLDSTKQNKSTLRTDNFLIQNFQSSEITIPANGALNVTATTMNYTIPTGYTPIAIAGWYTGSNDTFARSIEITAQGTQSFCVLRNVGSTAFTGNFQTKILFIKT